MGRVLSWCCNQEPPPTTKVLKLWAGAQGRVHYLTSQRHFQHGHQLSPYPYKAQTWAEKGIEAGLPDADRGSPKMQTASQSILAGKRIEVPPGPPSWEPLSSLRISLHFLPNAGMRWGVRCPLSVKGQGLRRRLQERSQSGRGGLRKCGLWVFLGASPSLPAEALYSISPFPIQELGVLWNRIRKELKEKG